MQGFKKYARKRNPKLAELDAQKGIVIFQFLAYFCNPYEKKVKCLEILFLAFHVTINLSVIHR